MRVSEKTLIDTTNVIGEVISITHQVEHLIGFSVSLKYEAGANFTGQFIVQASNNNTDWVNATCTDINGTNPYQLVNITEVFYKYVRVKVKPVTGSLTTAVVKIYTKGW